MEETVDKIEKDSKLLYKKYASIHLSHKTDLKKQTNYLEKWHGVSRKKINKQEELMRKSLERLSKEKEKYSPSSSTDKEEQNKDLQKSARRLSQQGSNPKENKATESNPQSRRGSKVDGDQSRRGSKVDEGEARRHSLVSKKESTKPVCNENVPSTSQMKETIEKAKEKKETNNAMKTEDVKEEKTTSPLIPRIVIDESNASKVSHVQDEPTPPPTISRRESSARRMSLGLPSSPRKSSITRRKSLGLSRESTSTKFDKLSGGVYDLSPQEIDLAKLNEIQELLHDTSQFRKRNKDKKCTDNRYFRLQQRRLCRLKEILAILKKPTPKIFTPRELLNCSYLRLSKSNVEELEQMIRDGGEDPGLHYHSDLSNYDLFSELRKEMADVIQSEEEVQCSTSNKSIISPSMKNDILHMRRHSNRD